MEHKLLQPWNAEQWLSAFGKAESDIHMLRALRKQVYEYTVQAATQGSYEIIKTDPETNAKQIKTISLALDPDIAKKTKMYRYEMHPAMQNRYDKTEYKVLSQDCLATAKEFVEQNEGKVAVLNLASRSNPGGGVHWGAGAQEEYCFRCSDYFRSLYQYEDYGYQYGVERSEESYPMDRNFGGVYSPGVTIFRGIEAEGYPFIENPWQVNFIFGYGSHTLCQPLPAILHCHRVRPVDGGNCNEIDLPGIFNKRITLSFRAAENRYPRRIDPAKVAVHGVAFL